MTASVRSRGHEEIEDFLEARQATGELCNGSIFKLLRTTEREKNAVTQKKWKKEVRQLAVRKISMVLKCLRKIHVRSFWCFHRQFFNSVIIMPINNWEKKKYLAVFIC